MRRSLFNAFFLFLFFYASSQKEPISTKIEKVTVFIKGAQVERVGKQNLSAGKYNIVFDGISPKIDKQSIQLKAEGKLTILSVTHQINFLKEQRASERSPYGQDRYGKKYAKCLQTGRTNDPEKSKH
jgi:hypothetical protein